MGLKTPKRLKQSVAYHRASKQEAELAGRTGGNVVKMSGAGIEKGDTRRRGYHRLEAKTTSKKSFSITLDMVRKIEAAALNAGEVPGIEVEFLDARGKRSMAVAVVPTYVLEMLGIIRDENA